MGWTACCTFLSVVAGKRLSLEVERRRADGTTDTLSIVGEAPGGEGVQLESVTPPLAAMLLRQRTLPRDSAVRLSTSVQGDTLRLGLPASVQAQEDDCLILLGHVLPVAFL
jgi:hypothetical protein